MVGRSGIDRSRPFHSLVAAALLKAEELPVADSTSQRRSLSQHLEESTVMVVEVTSRWWQVIRAYLHPRGLRVGFESLAPQHVSEIRH